MVFASYFLLSSKIRVQGTEANEKRRKKKEERKEKKMNDSFPGFMTCIKEKNIYIQKTTLQGSFFMFKQSFYHIKILRYIFVLH